MEVKKIVKERAMTREGDIMSTIVCVKVKCYFCSTYFYERKEMVERVNSSDKQDFICSSCGRKAAR